MDNKDICEFVGAVVQSKVGRDRKRYFLVVDTEGTAQDPRLMICDGNLHKVSSPKKKNPKHLTVVGGLEDRVISEMSDSDIRDVIVGYDPGLMTCKSGREDNFNAEG